MAKRLILLLCAAGLLVLAASTVAARDDPAQKALEVARRCLVGYEERGEEPPREAYQRQAALMREVVERYPTSPQATETLCQIGNLYCWRLSRYEEGIAIWEQVIELRPTESVNVINSLQDTILARLDRPERWQSEVEHIKRVLQRALANETDPVGRCKLLDSLVVTCDSVGGTTQAATFARQLVSAAAPQSFYADRAREYIEYIETWPQVRLTEESAVNFVTREDSLTPDTEVKQDNRRILGVAMHAPLGKRFTSSVTFSAPGAMTYTKPEVNVRPAPDGRTLATWEKTCEMTAHAWATCGTSYSVEALWKSKVHVEGARVSRSAEAIRPGREFVTVSLETDRPVGLEIWARDGGAIDVGSVRGPVDPTGRDKSRIHWDREPGSDGSRNLDCSHGRVFTFEMDLPPGVRLIMPRVTVGWSQNAWPLGPFATPLSLSPRTTVYNGAVGDVQYTVASDQPFRVISRWKIESAQWMLEERTERL